MPDDILQDAEFGDEEHPVRPPYLKEMYGIAYPGVEFYYSSWNIGNQADQVTVYGKGVDFGRILIPLTDDSDENNPITFTSITLTLGEGELDQRSCILISSEDLGDPAVGADLDILDGYLASRNVFPGNTYTYSATSFPDAKYASVNIRSVYAKKCPITSIVVTTSAGSVDILQGVRVQSYGSGIVQPASEADTARDEFGFTNPNLHRRIAQPEPELDGEHYELMLQGVHSYRTTTIYTHDEDSTTSEIP